MGKHHTATATANFTVRDRVALNEILQLTERFHTMDEVFVIDLPECDIHKFNKGEQGIPARYDGKTRMGPWANMCQECFDTYGLGLGIGVGQRLVKRPQ